MAVLMEIPVFPSAAWALVKRIDFGGDPAEEKAVLVNGRQDGVEAITPRVEEEGSTGGPVGWSPASHPLRNPWPQGSRAYEQEGEEHQTGGQDAC